MAQRRPIASHPAFAPFLALWFAALFGLAVAVLPARLLEAALGGVGAAALVPLTPLGRVVASGGAGILGGAIGLAIALTLTRRGRDPRPIYAEPEPTADDPVTEEPVRRPLRVREELWEAEPDGHADPDVDPSVGDAQDAEPAQIGANSEIPAFPTGGLPPSPPIRQSEDGLMILGSQPGAAARPDQDIDALLAQFDNALAAFRSGDDDGDRAELSANDDAAPDPVRAFVARQTSARAKAVLGGAVPDNQAELRAVLDKLARARSLD